MYEILDPGLNAPRIGPDPRRIQLPLDIMSTILSHIKSPADLSSIARASRIHHFLAVPLLYRTVALRRPSRRPRKTGGKRMALGALMKPGIAACVNVLEIVADDDTDDIEKEPEQEEWWEKGQWSDEDTVWAVAVAGVIAGMVRLDAFLWNANSHIHPLLYTALVRHPTLRSLRVSHPRLPPVGSAHANLSSVSSALSLSTSYSSANRLNRPPIASIPAFRTLRRLHLHNLPSISSFTDDYTPIIFFSPNIESLALSWRTPTPVGRMQFLQRLLKRPRPTGPMDRSGGPGPSSGATDRKLRLKELELRNVVFDFPMVGDVEEWIDMRRLEKLSLLDCEVIDVTSWLELIGAGVGGSGDNSAVFGVGASGYSFTQDSPASTIGSTPGTTNSSSGSSSVSRTVRLKLKSLRINSTASHWISLLNSFDGLEELYILDPPVEDATEAAHGSNFLDAITHHHGITLKKLRLCSRWHFERRDVSRLFRSCAGLEELAFSMLQSQWKILDVLIIFLTHLRYVHILDCSPLTHEELMSDLLTKKDALECMLAQDDLSEMEVFALANVIYRVDRTPCWDEVQKRKVRRGRFVGIEDVRSWVSILKAEEAAKNS